MSKPKPNEKLKNAVYGNHLPGWIRCPHCDTPMTVHVFCEGCNRFKPGEHNCPECCRPFYISNAAAKKLNAKIEEEVKEKEALLSA